MRYHAPLPNKSFRMNKEVIRSQNLYINYGIHAGSGYTDSSKEDIIRIYENIIKSKDSEIEFLRSLLLKEKQKSD